MRQSGRPLGVGGADCGERTACPHWGQYAASPTSARQFAQVVVIAGLLWRVNAPM